MNTGLYKLFTQIAVASLLTNVANSQTTNVMPSGFVSVFLGMSSNQLHQARHNVEWPGGNFASFEAREILDSRIFFDSVGYEFFPTNGLAAIHFHTTLSEQTKRAVMPGFIKGCIAKYGTNYEQRVRTVPSQPPMKIPILRWTNENTVVDAIFISDGNRMAYKNAGGGEIPLLSHRLLIYHKDAINIGGATNYLKDITTSVPANQDTTGQAFTNFPTFLDSYTGSIWQ